MLHLRDDQVRDLLPDPARAVELMRETLLALAEGAASVTPKNQVVHEEGGFANAMPAAWPERGLLGMKWVTVTPSNRVRGGEMIGGLMVLSAADGSTRATMNAAALTALRTAAVTGASLALDDRPVTFIGTGVQARSHARVLESLGRGLLTVWGRRRDALEELAAWCARAVPRVCSWRRTSVRVSATWCSPTSSPRRPGHEQDTGRRLRLRGTGPGTPDPSAPFAAAAAGVAWITQRRAECPLRSRARRCIHRAGSPIEAPARSTRSEDHSWSSTAPSTHP